MLNIQTFIYGHLSDGREVRCIHLENDQLRLKVLDYGLRLVSLQMKRSRTSVQEMILGGWPLPVYEADTSYHGAVVGRTCNRIAHSKFELNGAIYDLECNEGEHHLHGGNSGFHNRIWDFDVRESTVSFETSSPDGEAGYPGNCEVKVKVSLTQNSVLYEYAGHSDLDTLLDMTCHAYFCLDDTKSVLGHELTLRASRYVPVASDLIPTGELQSVSNTPFDFSQTKPVGQDIQRNIDSSDKDSQLQIANGYDHCWLLDEMSGNHPAASLYSPQSNIEMAVYTTQPAVQLYTGNHLEPIHSGLCLETQHVPNACNQLGFSSPELKAGEVYSQSTRFQFTIRAPNNDVDQS